MERRTFIKGATAMSAFTILKPDTVFGTKANSAVRLGIIGCGNRGSAVISSMSKNSGMVIVAMADLLQDKLDKALPLLNSLNAEKKMPEIAKSNIFQGSKAYQGILNNKDVDAVLISSPCYSHPGYIEAAISAGKHVYSEKPVSPDVSGCQKVMRIGEMVGNKLSLAIGFQIRYASAFVEMVKRIKQGDIGEIINVQLYYFSSGSSCRRNPAISYDEDRIRNHFHFNALSGGILVDQGIHMLDVCNWALGTHPLKAVGTGGKKGGAEFGDIWTNYQVLYEYPDNINVCFHNTQQGSQFGDVCARVIGSAGVAEAHYSGGVFIAGEKPWDSGIVKCKQEDLTEAQRSAGVFLSALHDADSNKDAAFIKSIETGNYLNEALQGSESTLTAILGRNAAASGKEITWEELVTSNEKLDPMLDLTRFDR